MAEKADIVVIGGGIAGLASALNLQERGRKVTLFDPLGFGGGCSEGSGGLINPDAHLPVAMPGMIRNVPRWLLDPLAPLAVRPADAIASIPFLAQWLIASRPPAVRRGVCALRALHRGVLREYRRLLGDAYPRHVHEKGGLTLLPGPTPSPAEQLADELRRELGIVSERLDRARLEELLPGIASFATRGIYFPSNAHTPDPAALCAALSKRFVGQGGKLVKARVKRIGIAGTSVAIAAEGHSMSARQVVIAAGARSPDLLRPLGCRIPMVAERGYHLQLHRPSIEIPMPLIYRMGGFALTPMDKGLRLGGTVEIASADAKPNYARAEALWGRACQLLPGLEAQQRTPWMGSRPALPDSVPAVGLLPRLPQVAVIAGHGHDGMIGGPASGRLIAELLCGEQPHVDPSPYRVDRFGWLTVLRQAA